MVTVKKKQRSLFSVSYNSVWILTQRKLWAAALARAKKKSKEAQKSCNRFKNAVDAKIKLKIKPKTTEKSMHGSLKQHKTSSTLPSWGPKFFQSAVHQSANHQATDWLNEGCCSKHLSLRQSPARASF